MGSPIITSLTSTLYAPLRSLFYLFNMIHKAPLQLFIILIGFSFVLSSAAVPTTRSLLSNMEKSSIQTSPVQGAVEIRNGEELMVENRMDLESEDYPGTGANNRHDPKSPGRA